MNADLARLAVVPAELGIFPVLVAKISLLLAAAWLVHAALGRLNPRWRVLVWRVTGIAIVLICVLAMSPPFVRLSVLPERRPELTATPAPASDSANPSLSLRDMARLRGKSRRVAAAPVDMSSRTGHLTEPRDSEAINSPPPLRIARTDPAPLATAAVTAKAEPKSASSGDGGRAVAPAVPSSYWLLGVWCAGAGFSALWTLIGLARLRTIRTTASSVPDWVRRDAARVAGALGVVRAFRLRQTQTLETPCLVGVLGPMILLPARQCESQHSDELPAILAHELVHLKGGDLVWNALLNALAIGLWFHPLAWRMRLAHVDACDAVCDALASDYVGDARLYGRTLARLTLRITRAGAAPGLAMARVSSVERRIAAVRRHVFRTGLSRRRAAFAVAIATAAISVLGGLALVPSQAEPPIAAEAKKKPSRAPSQSQNSLTIHSTASQTGQPIPDVEFEFHGRIGGKRFNKNIRAGADGVATFEWLAASKVENLWFTARAAKFVPIDHNWMGDQGEPEIPAHLDLHFDPGHEIGGVVRDESGRPIAGVTLTFHLPLTWPRKANWVFEATTKTTDENGRWSWSEAPADSTGIGIQLRHPDYPPKWVEASGHRDSAFVLASGLQVTGRVFDPQGKPVDRAKVALGFDRFGTNEPQTKTGADGRFTLKSCKSGRSIVTVQAYGLSPTFQELTVGEHTPPLDFHLEPGHTLKLRIVDPQGKPVAGVVFAPDTWRGHRSLIYSDKSSAKGEIVWRSAPDGIMLCDLLKQGYMQTRRVPLQASSEFQIVELSPELIISGHVTDRATGKPIPTFRLRIGILFDNNSRIYWSGDEDQQYKDGQFRIKVTEPRAGTLLEVVSAGYRPVRSRTFRATEGAQTFDFALERGRGPAGIVLLPDGKPAVGVDVGLANSELRAMLSLGRFNGQQNQAEVVKTDARGHFEFRPQDSNPVLAIALGDAGYAMATGEELAKDGRLKLRPWGRLKGRVLKGNKPDANCQVTFNSQNANQQPFLSFVFNFNGAVQTDSEGCFEIDRVFLGPGTVSRVVVTEFGRTSQVAAGWDTRVEIHEGQTTEVTVGGTGRPVTGQMRVEGTPDAPIEWTTNEPASIIKWDKKQGAAARPFVRYLGNIRQTGGFQIPDVPAGDYQIDVPVNAPPIPNACGAAQAMGRAHRAFTIPPIPGGQSETPFDLGELTATLYRTLKPGDLAPEFLVERLGHWGGGEQGFFRLSDLRGKVVLVTFWATWCGPCVAEIPQLQTIQTRFGKDPRFVQLSISCDNDSRTPRQFLEKQQGVSWFQGHVAGLTSRIPQDYAVRAIPATFLIGQDGRVLAKSLGPHHFEDQIAKALADDNVFAVASAERPARFPVFRVSNAPQAKINAPPALLVLENTNPSVDRDNKPHDEHLRLLSASGQEIWSQGGFSTTQTIGGNHDVAVDRLRDRIYICESPASRITAFNLKGQELWRIDKVHAGSIAVDERTGNVWTTLGGSLDDGEIVAFDLEGREVLAVPYPAFDIAHNPHDDSFWLAGSNVLKLNRKGDVLFKKRVEGWCYASVAVNAADGSVWLAEREHPDVAASKNRLWHLNSDGSTRKKIELVDYNIAVVACAPKTGEAWIGAYNGTVRRVSPGGELDPPLTINGKSISISPTNGEVWVANSEALVRLDSTGKILAKFPFEKRCLQAWLYAF